MCVLMVNRETSGKFKGPKNLGKISRYDTELLLPTSHMKYVSEGGALQGRIQANATDT